MDRSSLKLSAELRDLVRSNGQPAQSLSPERLNEIFRNVQQDPTSSKVSDSTLLIILTGVLFSLNQTEALPHLLQHAWESMLLHREASDLKRKVFVAGLMREIGLRTVSFLGIPMVINCLSALSSAIDTDKEVRAELSTESRRNVTPENVEDIHNRGRALWDDIYAPHHDKLLAVLAHSHPDLPIHILQSHYGPLLSALPPSQSMPTDLSREQSSVLAVTCLRALGGVGRQVESHVYGLRKAGLDGRESWMTSEDGCMWLLRTIDGLVSELAV